MANAIVGYTGLVGSNLLQFYKFDYFYNSKNFHNAISKYFDTIFFCGIPSLKWHANNYPEEDLKNIENIKTILDTIHVKKFILISTIDVYDEINNKYDENYIIKHNNNNSYGKNRYLFEEYIKSKFNYNIIRLPALFGKGLKKNIIYDLLNNNNLEKIPVNSTFQWYNLDWLKKDINVVLDNNIKICNFFTEPLDTKELIQIFQTIYPEKKIEVKNLDNKTIIHYNTCTKYDLYFNNKKYIKTKSNVIKCLKKFLYFEKKNKQNLCVSNICINNISNIQFVCLLKLYGINLIQIAPTKLIHNWELIHKLNDKINKIKKMGIDVMSFQSITYKLDNLNIFDLKSQESLYYHIIKLIDIAEENKVKLLVFGCPKNRQILDFSLNNNEIFINFFKKIGSYLDDKNIVVCIENNSTQYNCNFINTIKECGNIVRSINKKNIKMMIDIGNTIMDNYDLNDIKDYTDIVYNIDISQPFMKDFSSPHEYNYVFTTLLKKNNYNKTINLEMLNNNDNNDNELKIICKSLKNFINIYGIN